MWKIRSNIFTVTLSLLFFLPAIVESAQHFGPIDLQINNWNFHSSFHKFSGGNSKTSYVRIVKRDNTAKINNGFLLVNFKIIPLKSFFKSNSAIFVEKFQLRPNNRIFVFFRGKRGQSISLEINQEDSSVPPKASLDAEPQEILLGETSTLHWTTTNAVTTRIGPDIGTVGSVGSISVSPTETTNYTLTAIGVAGTTISQTTIGVKVPLPKITFTAHPASVSRGNSSVLMWSVKGATYCHIDQGIGTVGNSDSVEVFPTDDTTYTITAEGPGGTSQARYTVKVTLVKLFFIEKPEANYLTPENTLSSSRSALLHKDLDWYYTGFSQEALTYQKQLFSDAGLDPRISFRLVDENDEQHVLDKIIYKDGLIVLIQKHSNDIDGTVLTTGIGMVQEDNLWKITHKYSGDDEIAKYDNIKLTDCIANFAFNTDYLDDSCWHGNDLTNFNNTAGVLDKRKGIDVTTAKFNGSNTGLSREQLLDMPTKKFSIGGWIKAQPVDHTARIIEIGNGDDDSTAIVLETGPGIKYWLYVGGARVARKIDLDFDFHDDTWHHIYLTYDGSSMKFYIDGQLKDSHPASGTFDSTPRLNIGLHNPTIGNQSQFFKGQIDDIQIYNKALSAEELLEKFKNGES